MEKTTNFIMLRTFLKDHESFSRRGILTGKEVAMVKDALCIDQMDILELRNLRDFCVMYFDGLIDRNQEKAFNYQDTLSAITGVIDSQLFSLGAEV